MEKKKFLFVALALFLICPAMHSQKSVNKLFNEYSKVKGVEHVGIGKFTMTIASLFTDMMGVKGIDVLSFEGCEQDVKERINLDIASLKDKNYETMLSVNEGTERTKILVKLKDDFIQELIILSSGNDPALVRIKGKIKPSDIEKVMSNNTKDKE